MGCAKKSLTKDGETNKRCGCDCCCGYGGECCCHDECCGDCCGDCCHGDCCHDCCHHGDCCHDCCCHCPCCHHDCCHDCCHCCHNHHDCHCHDHFHQNWVPACCCCCCNSNNNAADKAKADAAPNAGNSTSNATVGNVTIPEGAKADGDKPTDATAAAAPTETSEKDSAEAAAKE